MVKLQKTLTLTDFPSASSIEYHNNHLYLVGDDATKLLVLDPSYKKVDSIELFESSDTRISKNKKTDLEASTTITVHNQPHLLMLGSASTSRREKAFVTSFTTSTTPKLEVIKTGRFFKRVSKAGIKEINIEGLVAVNNTLLLANRGNNKNRENHLIATTTDFFNNQEATSISIVKISFEGVKNEFAGISGLAYVPSKDLLLFTASTEDTESTVADGAIGNSYLGLVNNISQHLNSKEIKASKLINLSNEGSAFKGQKIESVCVESVQDNKIIVHLVADNDNGESTLFKVQLIL